jgi:hypothetical protein
LDVMEHQGSVCLMLCIYSLLNILPSFLLMIFSNLPKYNISFRLKFHNDVVYQRSRHSIHSPPNATLLEQSLGTLWTCHYQGSVSFRVVDISTILAVVAVIPLPHYPIQGTYFVVEKPGLDIAELTGATEELVDE